MFDSIGRVFILLFFSFVWSIGSAQILPGNVVDTQYGPILGNRRIFSGQLYEEYLSIPFAQPPVGALRWQKPRPVEPWDDILNGTEFSAHCIQLIAPLYALIGMGARVSEDCLYLNVWVPGGVNLIDEPLPVMVFVYGGGYTFGTGEMYPGHGLALYGNVIVVNFNYRVSVMGWLSTENSVSPGNYGLWDAQAAFLWVRDNIASFKGDPDRVTIFGQSAGGGIVSHSVISPHTNTLFQSASAISGSSLLNTMAPGEALNSAILLGVVMNCTFEDREELVGCLREKDGIPLVYQASTISSRFAPVIDGDFVVRDPRESISNGEGKHINLMTGNAYLDSANFIIGNPLGDPLLGDRLNRAATNESLWQNFRGRLRQTTNADDLINKIFKMYPELDTTDNYTRTLAASKCQTEWQFASFSNWQAVQHAKANGTGKTFSYNFQHRQSFLIGYPEWINGSHLDDMYSILGTPFMQTYRTIFLREDYDDVDTAVMENTMNHYSNFAYTGNPNIGPYQTVIEWPEFDELGQNFLRQSPTFEIGSYYEDNMMDRFRFWTDEFPLLMEFPQPPLLPFLDDILRPANDEIEDDVERLKEYLYEVIEDEVISAEFEETIRGFF